VTDALGSLIVIAVAVAFIAVRRPLSVVAAEIWERAGGRPLSERLVRLNSHAVLVIGLAVIAVMIVDLVV
jgi:hypothetical protein